MNADLLAWLAEATLLSSVAILLALLLRQPLRRLFGARSAILIWLLVPLAILVPILPDRVADHSAMADRPVITMQFDDWSFERDASQPFDANPSGKRLVPVALVLALWLAGTALMLLRMVWRQRQFRAGLGPLRCRAGRLWLSERTDIGPLLLGLIAPRVIVPRDFARRFDARQRRLMLAHEYTHLRRGDPIWNLLTAAFRCLFWFNPLAHLAAAFFRRDQELACDAQVLGARRGSRRRYAAALLALQCQSTSLPVLAFGPHPLKERIMQLSTLKSETLTRRRFGALTCLFLSAGLALAAWAVTPEIQGSGEDAGEETLSSWFAFDVEVTVEGQIQLGRMTVTGDQALISPYGEERIMRARDTLTIKHRDEASGWSAEVTIKRHGDDHFWVDAEIQKHGEMVATPSMIIDGHSPASIQQGDPETGEMRYRLQLTPISAELSVGNS
ncbi:MAG: M56 family metallopeptidase [Wenzhouxiangella sp.]